MGQQDPGTDPSPAEIRAMCKAIREGWTADVERSRRTGSSKRDHVEVTEVKVPRDLHKMDRPSKDG